MAACPDISNPVHPTVPTQKSNGKQLGATVLPRDIGPCMETTWVVTPGGAGDTSGI